MLLGIRINKLGISLMVQWLRLLIPNEGIWGSTPGQGARSHMHSNRYCTANKTQYSQINKHFFPLKGLNTDVKMVEGILTCTSPSFHETINLKVRMSFLTEFSAKNITDSS